MQDHELVQRYSKALADCLKGIGIFSAHKLSPLNLHEEREKFLASDTYNPQFIYNQKQFAPITETLESLKNEINSSVLSQAIKDYFLNLVIEVQKSWELRVAMGNERFSKVSQEMFNSEEIFSDPELVSEALKTNSLSELFPDYEFNDDISQVHNAEEIQKFFADFLSQNYPGVILPIELSEHVSYAITASMNGIRIGVHVQRSGQDLLRLVVHEVESHVLQSLNAKNCQLPHLRTAKTFDQVLLSEGLAVYNEYATKTLTRWAARNYLIRLLAVDLIPKSFREIYEAICEHLPETEAFTTTLRVKRGMTDTSKPGGYEKDAAYYSGFRKIKSLIDSGEMQHRDFFAYKSTGKEAGLMEIQEFLSDHLLLPKWLEVGKDLDDFNFDQRLELLQVPK